MHHDGQCCGHHHPGDDTLKQIKEVIAPYVKDQDAFTNATDQTSFLGDLKINSARLVDIVIAFEDKFGITISDEEAEKITTIGAARQLIASKKK
jgi:acyl carrier protein